MFVNNATAWCHEAAPINTMSAFVRCDCALPVADRIFLDIDIDIDVDIDIVAEEKHGISSGSCFQSTG